MQNQTGHDPHIHRPGSSRKKSPATYFEVSAEFSSEMDAHRGGGGIDRISLKVTFKVKISITDGFLAFVSQDFSFDADVLSIEDGIEEIAHMIGEAQEDSVPSNLSIGSSKFEMPKSREIIFLQTPNMNTPVSKIYAVLSESLPIFKHFIDRYYPPELF